MKPLGSCPLCRGVELTTVASFRFVRPAASAEELATAGGYADLRLAVMFENLLPEGLEVHELRTAACRACGFVALDPAWEEADIARKYERLGELLPPPAHRQDQAVRARRVRRLIRRYQTRPSLRVVDVGGSTGYALAEFVAAGDDAAVLDIDPGKLAPGVRLAGSSFADAGAERFDAVLCLHTLEHVAEPREFLRGLVGLLAPGGVLYVEVPLGTLIECRALQEPLTHVGFFCEESLHHAFRAAGLRVLHASTDLQWVVGGPQWCVNLVGCLDDGGGSVPPVPAGRQQTTLGVLSTRGKWLRHPLRTARAVAARLLKRR